MKKITQESAFTIAEFVVGLGVLSIVLAMTITTQHQIDKEMKIIDNQIENKIDSLGGERVLLFDLQDASLSFNNVVILDNSNKNFFDYIPEFAINSVISEPQRKLTLSLTTPGAKSEIVVIADNLKSGVALIYDPVEAYNIGALPTNINSGSSLNFQSVNKNDYIKMQRPNFWLKNNMLLFDTTSRIRPQPTTMVAEIDMAIPPRSSFYVGKVNVDSNSLVNIPVLAPYLNLGHPETGDLIDSADTFLRTVTATGGGVPTIKARVIKIMRYFLKTEPDNKVNFYKSYFDPELNSWGNPVLISSKVSEVIFQRQSVSSKLISFKINHVQ